MSDKQNYRIEDFDEYICQGEPDTCMYKLRKKGRNNLVWMSQQRQDKYRTSTGEVLNQIKTDNQNIQQIALAIGEQQMSVMELMEALSLKGRDNFLKVYPKPAIEEQYVRLLCPNSSRHPKQKYL